MKFAILVLASSFVPIAAAAQSGTHTGCVKPWTDEPETLLLAEADSCSVLKGKLATKSLAGHTVTLSGAFTDATSSAPQSITVEKISRMTEACSETCTPQPPGHRGLSKHERPGGQGGTQGRDGTPPPQ